MQPNADLYNVDALITSAENSMTTQEKATFSINKDLRKLLLIEQIYLIEILRDIYCIWRQPYCNNSSICPGNDFWKSTGLTQLGAETIGYIFNHYKQHNSIQILLEKHILIPELKTPNSMFENLDGNKRTNLIPSSIKNELRKHQTGLFKKSWSIWLTTSFFSLSVKIHPKRNIPEKDTSSSIIYKSTNLIKEDIINYE